MRPEALCKQQAVQNPDVPGAPALCVMPHTDISSNGFTLLEVILVLFLMGGLLSLVIPRMSIGDNLSSTARKWAGTLKSLQEMSMTTQKPVRLYVEMEQATYWPVILHGNEEKRPLDPIWATPRTLPETVRFTDFRIAGTRQDSGRVEILFYPNGRIDPAVMHLTDTANDVMGVKIEPVTSLVRVTDQRIDPPIPRPIPERIRTLLQPAQISGQLSQPTQTPKLGRP